jgi:23S rRNA (guanosine2251-2'-O)-methyltransferase
VLRGRRRVNRVLLATGIHEDGRVREIMNSVASRHLPVERVDRRYLDEMTNLANHQGVAAEASAYPYVGLDEITAACGTVLVLDHLQDPQNLGTLIRAADAAGVAGVVIPQDRAAEVTPAVVNASAGAVEHVRIARVPNLPRALSTLKGAGWWSICLDSRDGAVDLFVAALPFPAALVVGGEGGGVGSLVRKQCDLIAAIPMRGTVASLNAATAGSIALFELERRRRAAGS